MRFLEAKLAAAFIATMWVSAAVGNGCSADNTPQGGSPVASVNQPPGVLNPSTSEDTIKYVLSECDLVLVMSVNPGFGGQKFISNVIPKIAAIHEMAEAQRLHVDIEVDGGIGVGTAGRVVRAGAGVLVAGNAVFGATKGLTDPSFEERVAKYSEAITAIRNDAANIDRAIA